MDDELPVGLRYSSDIEPGFGRIIDGKKTVFIDEHGAKLTGKHLARAKSLVIPPAWTQVWICPVANGHLQATGRDQKGRKQAIYHPDWSQARAAQKFEHLHEFGATLPIIRRTIESDLASRGMVREKILAAVVQLLDDTLIRIGNQRYEIQNKSFGLTTLRNRHVHVVADRLEFDFVGKSGKPHRITLKNRTLGSIIRRCQELPGQHLFCYLDKEGQLHEVSSTEVNEYLNSISNKDITAKEFRTWGGTIEAIRLVREVNPTTPRQIAAVVKEVAKKLGNTPSVCRAHYIHPGVLDLNSHDRWRTAALPRSRKYLDAHEVLFLDKIAKNER